MVVFLRGIVINVEVACDGIVEIKLVVTIGNVCVELAADLALNLIYLLFESCFFKK